MTFPRTLISAVALVVAGSTQSGIAELPPDFTVSGRCVWLFGIEEEASNLVVVGQARSGSFPAASTRVECTIFNRAGSGSTDGFGAGNVAVTAGHVVLPLSGGRPTRVCITAVAEPQDLSPHPPPASVSSCSEIRTINYVDGHDVVVLIAPVPPASAPHDPFLQRSTY